MLPSRISPCRCSAIAAPGLAPGRSILPPSGRWPNPLQAIGSPMHLEMAQYAIGALSGALVGLSLGLFGGGGLILAVPLMVYLVGVTDAHIAIGTSAVAVTANAAT